MANFDHNLKFDSQFSNFENLPIGQWFYSTLFRDDWCPWKTPEECRQRWMVHRLVVRLLPASRLMSDRSFIVRNVLAVFFRFETLSGWMVGRVLLGIALIKFVWSSLTVCLLYDYYVTPWLRVKLLNFNFLEIHINISLFCTILYMATWGWRVQNK